MGVGAVLEITRTALIAQRTAIEVTGHNIANADTEGYSRQSAVMASRSPLPMGPIILGTGVQVDQILRSYNRFASMNIDRQTSTLGDLQARGEYLSVLETAFNELEGGGLNSRLSAFWAGWQDVANNPAGSAERLALIQSSEELVSLTRDQSEKLGQVGAELRMRIIQGVSEINEMLTQIAQLNNQIVGMEVGGGQANDLRDLRDALLSRLSEEVGANYMEGPDGQVTIFIAGRLMVDGCNAYSLETAASGSNSVEITWHGSQPGTEDISSQIEGGRLGGYLTLLQETLPECATRLDDFAASLIYEVNNVHSQGVGRQAATSATGVQQATNAAAAMATAASGLDYYGRIDDSGSEGFKVHVYDASGSPLAAGGTTVTITAGMTLNDLAAALDAVAGISASVSDGYLSVSAAAGEGGSSFAFSEDTSGVLAALGLGAFFSGHDAASIAVATTADEVAAGRVQADSTFGIGDGSNALAMADLEDAGIDIGGTTQTFSAALASLVGDMGVESAAVQRGISFQEALVDQLASQRDSETGVSLDEELTNMMKFQHAYTAAAKLLATADEMLRTLVEVR